MSSPFQCQILDAFEALLIPLSLSDGRVYRGRVFSKEGTPGHSIYAGEGKESVGHALSDSTLLVRQLITVSEHEKNLDSKTFEVFNQSYVAIMADITLGLSFVKFIELVGNDEPTNLEGSVKPIQQTEFSWMVHYRHSTSDMSILS